MAAFEKHTPSLPILMVVLAMSHGKPLKPDPPVWEYHYQYSLFEKIYDQTQAILRLLKQALEPPPTRCPGHWTPLLDSCYFLPLHWKKRWLDAEETCERLGAHLAILNSELEDSLVSEYLRNVSSQVLQADPSYVWIGGFDFHEEGDWRWVSGEQFNYTNWRMSPDGSPPAIRRSENCLDWSEGWNDNNCGREFHFLCEKDKS